MFFVNFPLHSKTSKPLETKNEIILNGITKNGIANGLLANILTRIALVLDPENRSYIELKLIPQKYVFIR
jgi:hypothetical protein